MEDVEDVEDFEDVEDGLPPPSEPVLTTAPPSGHPNRRVKRIANTASPSFAAV